MECTLWVNKAICLKPISAEQGISASTGFPLSVVLLSHDTAAKQSNTHINHHSPNAFSPVACDQPTSSRNPSLSSFLITLAVQTDKGQGRPAPRALTYCVLQRLSKHRKAPTPVSMAKPGFLIFAMQCIYHQRKMS